MIKINETEKRNCDLFTNPVVFNTDSSISGFNEIIKILLQKISIIPKNSLPVRFLIHKKLIPEIIINDKITKKILPIKNPSIINYYMF